MKPQKIFIEVAVADELPPDGFHFATWQTEHDGVKYDAIIGTPEIKEKEWVNDPGEVASAPPTHWLKPIPAAYVFTREELEAFWDKAFEAGGDYMMEQESSKSVSKKNNNPDSKTLFNQLVK
jgi:hypothetical protein